MKIINNLPQKTGIQDQIGILDNLKTAASENIVASINWLCDNLSTKSHDFTNISGLNIVRKNITSSGHTVNLSFAANITAATAEIWQTPLVIPEEIAAPDIVDAICLIGTNSFSCSLIQLSFRTIKILKTAEYTVGNNIFASLNWHTLS